MPLPSWLVHPLLDGLIGCFFRPDIRQLERVPLSGPLILVTNHINFVEIPILYTRLYSRPLTVFVKQETWNSRLTHVLFDMSRAIPVARGEADTTALRHAIETLKQGRILALSPEGTRSGDGKLRQAHPGVVMIAQRGGAPILPIACYGHESYRQNMRRLRRTDFRLKVGEPFRLKLDGIRITSDVRQQVADEIMFQIAALLPQTYRGRYSALDTATHTYLEFSVPAQSGIHKEGLADH